MKKKLLITSSGSDPCGIAEDVAYLEGPLRESLADWEVEVFPPPTEILHLDSSSSAEPIRSLMKDMVNRVSKADVVILHFDTGIFGRSFFGSSPRLKMVLAACKKVIITHHSVGQFTYLKRRSILRPAQIKEWIRYKFTKYMFRWMFLQFSNNPSKFIHVVHTRRDIRLLALLGAPASGIRDMPPSYLTLTMKRHYAEGVGDARKRIDKRYGTAGKKILGCFGFIAPYKGIDVAVKALELLPDDYVLLVVGGIHPTCRLRSENLSYVESLLELATAKGIRGRVHFCGQTDKEEFTQIMSACEGVLLPYLEVGQSASGPASMALDLQRPLYCARNNAFSELEKYAAGAIIFFEVGNYVELAGKILNEDALSDKQIAAGKKYAEKYNVEARAELYAQACRRLVNL